jgi:hypothetical protein
MDVNAASFFLAARVGWRSMFQLLGIPQKRGA